MARREGRARGTLEREVLTCLAAAGGPLTPSQVQSEIGGDLAYTTVMTTLSRLYAKGALHRAPVRRAYAYSLKGGAEQARSNITAHQMIRLLDDDHDRAEALSRFVSELGPEDARLLADLLGPQLTGMRETEDVDQERGDSDRPGTDPGQPLGAVVRPDEASQGLPA